MAADRDLRTYTEQIEIVQQEVPDRLAETG